MMERPRGPPDLDIDMMERIVMILMISYYNDCDDYDEYDDCNDCDECDDYDDCDDCNDCDDHNDERGKTLEGQLPRRLLALSPSAPAASSFSFHI